MLFGIKNSTRFDCQKRVAKIICSQTDRLPQGKMIVYHLEFYFDIGPILYSST